MLRGEHEPGHPMTAVPSDSKPIDDPRIYLAAERTFLAWIRTSISLMGFGFLIARFALFLRAYGLSGGGPTPTNPWLSNSVGVGMVGVGVVVCVLAAVRHRAYIEALKKGVGNPPLDVGKSLIVAAVLALVGLAIAIHLVTL
jgi:putative membrane protein